MPIQAFTSIPLVNTIGSLLYSGMKPVTFFARFPLEKRRFPSLPAYKPKHHPVGGLRIRVKRATADGEPSVSIG